MGVLEGLEPVPVFRFFEEICKIPHGSGNEAAISDYLKKFADERGLFCIQDEWKNIIIVKEAVLGKEAEETLILQGHMDMVAVKAPDCAVDMQKEPLRLTVDGDFISAEGTSLGGDDGIAVAYILALLDSKEIPHPRLEAVLTVGEEVGMDGAREIDLSMLKGRRMLNLDNEEEGVLLTSCAGGLRADCKLPIAWEKRSGSVLHIQVTGLQGGHSGAEIIKEGGNSNCLMGLVMDALVRETSASLLSREGGL
ncbi:MAG: M20/M25/M40 family metallo-hydrolase, partial [Lachnospiraceae bacterium]|nr:M20/M25/M40 family metallo-hydrolase [Lachnospiraceae bacterium]